MIFSRTSKHKIYNMKSLHCHDLSSQSGNLGFEGREQSKEAAYMGVPPPNQDLLSSPSSSLLEPAVLSRTLGKPTSLVGYHREEYLNKWRL